MSSGARISINVKNKKDLGETWMFNVEVSENGSVLGYFVTLDKDYWKKLTQEKYEPEKLVEASFKFLLDRESKEKILRDFNLKLINSYFPAYEIEVGKYLR